MNKLWYLALVLLLGVASCKKKTQEPIDLGCNYFPNEERFYVIYNVDSISYQVQIDTFHFQYKELLAAQYTDAEGEAAMRIERYKRNHSTEPWVQCGNWTQKRTPTTAERVEDNVRYINLIFPLEAGKTWKGNAYNTLGDWDYSIEYLAQPANLGLLSYDKTLKVVQRNNVNLVDKEIAYEIFAESAGLVYRKWTDLNVQPDHTTGFDVTWRAVATGTE